jgi:hypothetical protein
MVDDLIKKLREMINDSGANLTEDQIDKVVDVLKHILIDECCCVVCDNDIKLTSAFICEHCFYALDTYYPQIAANLERFSNKQQKKDER